MAVRPPEDDWFAEAAKEVGETKKAKEIARLAGFRDRQAERDRATKERRDRARATPATAAIAAMSYGITPGGGRSMGTFPTPPPPTPPFMPRVRPGRERPDATATESADKGLQSIVYLIQSSASANDPDAVLKVAGQWITKITNAITQVVKDTDAERDE